MVAKKYFDQLVNSYVDMYGVKPKQTVTSPLEKWCHPEVDTSEILCINDVKKHQYLIGSLQWVVSLGRLEVATTVMTMSKFRVEPKQGHLDYVRWIVAYISKMKHVTIHFPTEPLDYSGIPVPEYD